MVITMPDFLNISPDTITEFVSFYRDEENKNKLYSQCNPDSMQAKQAEGAAYLFNLLNEKRLALLADEVGMGKTIQSLAVCAALWHQKPDAKILVLAPRTEVANNWINEYKTFIDVHYKLNDDVVKSVIGGEMVNPPIYCDNLYTLISNLQEEWGRLFIGKISSFSSLLSKDDRDGRLKELQIKPNRSYNGDEEKQKVVQEIASQLRVEATKYLNEGTFDLVIIDEAHYFRNVDGGSLRVNAAKAFFGANETKLADRSLLLTATPNHSSSDNINSIVSYFDDGRYSNSNYTEILDEVCLRRLRRLSSKGLVKYNYRRERPKKSGFEDRELAELFFGVYQKQLVSDFTAERNNGSTRNMLGFLEGTEFIPQGDSLPNDQSELREGSDYNSGFDGKMLQRLSREYKRIFKDFPEHPKYTDLVDELTIESGLAEDNARKSLVFVRRIPSVREIAARVIHRYDVRYLNKLTQALGVRVELESKNFRRNFNLAVQNQLSSKDEEEDEETDENLEEVAESESHPIPSSKVLDLFKRYKSDSDGPKSTHASNFRLRFSRSKLSAFNIFFCPGSDYQQQPYYVSIGQSKEGAKGFVDNHFLTCLKDRTMSIENAVGVSRNLQGLLGGGHFSEFKESNEPPVQLETLFTIYWKYLDKTARLTPTEKNEIVQSYLRLNYYQKEALGSFLEKGVLLASGAIVDLYSVFLRVSKKSKLQSTRLYQEFTKQLSKQFEQTDLPRLVTASILHFNILCEKVFGLRSSEDVVNNQWKNFFDANPAYPYSGDTKNQRVMLSFNTPFYPDVLISTSVLQEGVNLQYFCDRIIHYGIAWTPGDNEQRVGRIDRMFSLVEQKLEADSESVLDIQYPYLHNTIDQDHVANFIHKKYVEENLIDKCRAVMGKANLSPEEFNYENWQLFFRTPNNGDYQDPYPPKHKSFIDSGFKLEKPNIDSNLFVSKILSTFKQLGYDPLRIRGYNRGEICLIDPTLEGGRKQPVMVDLKYNAFLSGVSQTPVHLLTMVTPLGTSSNLNRFEKCYGQFKEFYENRFMSVKLCHDPSQLKTSVFGLYMKVELPVFIDHVEDPLSSIEIEKNVQHLVSCADSVEQIVFNGKEDIDIKRLTDKEPEQIGVDTSRTLRQTSNSTGNVDSWNLRGQYRFRKKFQRKADLWSFKEQLLWNHEDLVVKYCSSEGSNRMYLSYLCDDIQHIEMEFLNRLFNYMAQEKFWT